MKRPKKVTTNAMVTWLGEDHLHEGGYGPRSNTWNGIVFPKDEPVEVTDPRMIAKAKANRFYDVDGERSEPEPVQEPAFETAAD